MAKTSAIQSLKLQDQARKASGSLPELMLSAERVAASVLAGAHGRKKAGAGDKFWQFRDYDGQESASRIDWRQTAKRDRLSVREQEWSALQTALLWVDDSPSMHFRSDEPLPTKLEAARILALSLAMLMIKAGEAVGSADFAVRPSCGSYKTEQLAAWLLQTRQRDLPPALEPKPNRQHVWFSDALFDGDVLHQALRQHANAGQKGVFVHLVDPAEAELPYRGRKQFVGLEGEQDWLVQKSEAVKETYQERWQAHVQRVKTLVTAAGWPYTQALTQTSLIATLGQIHALLQIDPNGQGVRV